MGNEIICMKKANVEKNQLQNKQDAARLSKKLQGSHYNYHVKK